MQAHGAGPGPGEGSHGTEDESAPGGAAGPHVAGQACTAPRGDSQVCARGCCGPSFAWRVTQRWGLDCLGLCSVRGHTDGTPGSAGLRHSHLCSLARLAHQPFLSEHPEVLEGGSHRPLT